MKIAIASDDGKRISAHFGRTRGFQIYTISDCKVEGSEYLENTFTGHAMGMHHEHAHGAQHQHGAGGHHQGHGVILEALKECDVVISMGMGRRIYNDLMNAGKEVFITDETTTDAAVEKYLKQELVDNPDKSCSDKH